MIEFGWPEAAAFVGSVATVAGVIYRIIIMKSTKSIVVPDNCIAKLQKIETEQAVQEEQMLHLKEEMVRLHTGFDKLNDLLLRLLTEK